MKTEYKRWQVVAGVVLFLLVMGIVGRIDRESQQALVEANTSVMVVRR